MLDDAGHSDCIICVSNDIDEQVLLSLKAQDAKIDLFGIGTRLITSYDAPSLGGVYKLCAIEENGKLVPKIKLSDTQAKSPTRGLKRFSGFTTKTALQKPTLSRSKRTKSTPTSL